MSDIFQEIEKDIRRERLDKFWERYRFQIISALVTIVVGVAGFLWYGEATQRRNAALSDQYLAATELMVSGNEAAGMAALDEIIAEASGGYVVLASMQKAARLAGDGQTDEAVRTYDAIRSSNKTEDVLGQLAAIKAGWLLVESENYAAMNARLGDIAFAEEEGPWAAAATEILAYSAVREENFEEAESLYSKIRGMRSATMGIVGRTAEMQSIIQPRIVKPVADEEAENESVADPLDETYLESAIEAPATDSGDQGVDRTETEDPETEDDHSTTPPEGE